ncbi:TetR/AcrR family transcriptional regulator [Gordonia sp. HY002]|uniref:TetR/AcrR family transcriptional regulator n=1 Tax=Gordonia zhenghanii TaxID=2911516 RepID=UPI001EF141F9|nr:TetR/AcrR family transcriptional regulator [Gordonia zhenghanii]MCF8571681.1 TetR/AcrR family transcriptional regulator [Gordonia zhenghanii]MCF8602704.1 TetR/AcrR family transcriptional regulator [Gordonia zhenghanii]
MSNAGTGVPATEKRSRRGRPKSVGLGDRRRAQLTEAAYEVFADKGYDEASVSMIAQHAGVGQGTLYRYVDGKRELLDLVVDLCIERLMAAVAIDEVRESISSPDSDVAGSTFRDLGDRLYRLVDEDPRLLQILSAQVGAVDKELRYRITGLYSTVDSMIMNIIEDVNERDWLAVDDEQMVVVSRTLPALGVPGLVLVLTGGEFDTPERRARYVNAAVRIERHGIMKRTDRADDCSKETSGDG